MIENSPIPFLLSDAADLTGSESGILYFFLSEKGKNFILDKEYNTELVLIKQFCRELLNSKMYSTGSKIEGGIAVQLSTVKLETIELILVPSTKLGLISFLINNEADQKTLNRFLSKNNLLYLLNTMSIAYPDKYFEEA